MTVNVGGNMVKRNEKEVAEEKKEEVKINPSDYWCDVILRRRRGRRQRIEVFLLMLLTSHIW